MYCKNIYSQHPSLNPNWELIFEDNFNTLNRTNWNVIDGMQSWEIPQWKVYYRDNSNNVYINSGELNLDTRLENFNGQSMTSGRLVSTNSYGKGCYYEFRTKYDNKYEIYSSNPNDNKGFWPAIWMLGGSCPGNYQEIDFYDNQLKGQVYTVGYIYCDVNSNRSENGKYAPFNNFIFNENNFNINAGLWTKKTINYILNDQIVYSSINNDAISYPMQIRIDQNCDVMNSSLYPIKHVIDYVRIWRLRKDCNTIVTIIPNFNTFTYGIKKSITLSNSTTIPLNSNISLLATDYIELNNNFFIPNNTEIEFGTTDCDF
jgi:beta-glucanase (GH16 family)